MRFTKQRYESYTGKYMDIKDIEGWDGRAYLVTIGIPILRKYISYYIEFN